MAATIYNTAQVADKFGTTPRTTIDAIDDAIDAIDTQLDNAMIEYANADIDAIQMIQLMH